MLCRVCFCFVVLCLWLLLGSGKQSSQQTLLGGLGTQVENEGDVGVQECLLLIFFLNDVQL